MKTWIISNTKFGYKNGSSQWLSQMINYFENDFIPLLEKRNKPGDFLIHLGNLFEGSDHISTLVLNSIQDIFEKISSIIPMKILVGLNDLHSGSKNNKINSLNIFKHFKNIDIITSPITENGALYLPWTKTPIKELSNSPDIIFMNTDYLSYGETIIREKCDNKTVFCGFYNDYMDDVIIRVGAPYQLEKTSETKGFCVFDSTKGKHVFIKNESSPRFKTITITDESQIETLDAEDIKKNFVSAVIDQSLLGSKRVRMDILLSKYAFKNISYSVAEPLVGFVSESDIDVMRVCREHLKNSPPETVEEFERIVKIKQERYKI